MSTRSQDAPPFTVAGQQVRCAHCGGVEFHRREVLMNTRGVTFLNLDWLNRSASTLTCQQCGHIEWFSQQPGVAVSS